MAKNRPTLFSWNSLYPVTAALYCWCWTANPWSECAFLAGFTNVRKELSYHIGVSLPSSASGTWVNYITLFASELAILFISLRKTNFTSVLLCAQISSFLDFISLILPTNKRFLLSFYFQLNLYCSFYYFALLRKNSKFPVSAQLAGLLRLFLKHRKLLCCLFCSAAVYDHSPKSAMLAQFPGAWSPWKLSQDFWNTSPNSDNLT